MRQLGKMLIKQELGENSIFNRSKKGRTLLNLLSISTIEPLMFSL